MDWTNRKTFLPEQSHSGNDVIYISEDETPPPPPRWAEECLTATVLKAEYVPEISGGENNVNQRRSPSILADEDLMIDDLELSAENLNDSFILEFYRSFCGMSDTTLDRRPPTAHCRYLVRLRL